MFHTYKNKKKRHGSRIWDDEHPARFEEAKLKDLMTKAVLNLANAREKHGRSESNIGLFEERISMIDRNRSQSLKRKWKP